MTIKCPSCNSPMRFLGSIGVQIAGGFGEVVGIECSDENCKKHRVVLSTEWLASLEWGPEEKLRGVR